MRLWNGKSQKQEATMKIGASILVMFLGIYGTGYPNLAFAQGAVGGPKKQNAVGGPAKQNSPVLPANKQASVSPPPHSKALQVPIAKGTKH
jgi:hypothetical protein